MRAYVRRGKKGRWNVVSSEGDPIPKPTLLVLAHELREEPGVKRAVVRHDGIYMRVDLSVHGLLRQIKRRVAVFFGKLNQSPKSRHRGSFHRTPPAVLAARQKRSVPKAKLAYAS